LTVITERIDTIGDEIEDLTGTIDRLTNELELLRERE